MAGKIRRLLVANRSEIAIRVFRAAAELGIRTVAIYAEEDKLSLHRFKADEAYQVGRGAAGDLKLGPLEAYLSDPRGHPRRPGGEGRRHPSRATAFLSESPEFADACAANGIIFIGPSPKTMRTLGNKVAARNLAHFGRRAGDAGDRAASRRRGRDQAARRRRRLSRDAEGLLGRRRARHAADRARGQADRRGALGQARGDVGLRQGRGLSGKAGAPRPPCRGAIARRHARQSACICSSATARSSAATRRSSSARRRPSWRRRRAPRCARRR